MFVDIRGSALGLVHKGLCVCGSALVFILLCMFLQEEMCLCSPLYVFPAILVCPGITQKWKSGWGGTTESCLESCAAVSDELQRSRRLSCPYQMFPRQSECPAWPAAFIRTVKSVQRYIPVKPPLIWKLNEPSNSGKEPPFLGKM